MFGLNENQKDRFWLARVSKTYGQQTDGLFDGFVSLYGDSVSVFLTPMREQNMTFRPIFSVLVVVSFFFF